MNEDNQENCKVKRKKKKIRWGRVITFLLLFIFVIGVGGYAGMFLYNFFVVNNQPVPITTPDKVDISQELLAERTNILLLGIDDGDNEFPDAPKRTDAMLVASINPEKKQISILSIPRDTMVKIPNRAGFDKANHAYAYGGATLARKTIANVLGIPIHYYVKIDWLAFIKIIDVLGGFNLYVEKNMYYKDPYADLEIDLKEGYQFLNGEQAGKYVRFRTDELGDIGRVQRQQRFLKALAEQHLNIETISKIPDIVQILDKYIETDMSLVVLAKVINNVKSIDKAAMKTEMLPGDFATINGHSYWKIDEKTLNSSLKNLELDYNKAGLKK